MDTEREKRDRKRERGRDGAREGWIERWIGRWLAGWFVIHCSCFPVLVFGFFFGMEERLEEV